MLHTTSDRDRIKRSATTIYGAMLELPRWSKGLILAMLVVSALNSISTFGEAVGRAIYHLSHH